MGVPVACVELVAFLRSWGCPGKLAKDRGVAVGIFLALMLLIFVVLVEAAGRDGCGLQMSPVLSSSVCWG